MLEVSSLCKRFGALVVTDDVALTVAKGERRALIGPNGAGKTTLFNMLAGELMPTSGTIRLDGRDVTRSPPDRRARQGIGRSFQRNNLFFDMSVRDNLVIACTIAQKRAHVFWRPLTGFADIRARAEALADDVGLGGESDTIVRAMSYGSQRQLEIALALANRPRLLLLDEPTAGMSPEETLAMKRLIAGLQPDLTILLIEHDMDVVFDLAHRISVLNYGRVVAEGTPDEIRGSAVVRDIYLGSLQDA